MNPIQKNITKTLELDGLPSEEGQEILLQVGAIIYQNVLVRVMEVMSEKDKDEFEKLLDNNASAEEIFSFLNKSVSNFEKIIDEEALKFKNKSDTIMGQIGK